MRSGNLNLGGTFRAADVAGLRRTGGAVLLTGALDNTGQTLTLNSTTGSWDFFGTTQASPAKITGGVVETKDGTSLRLGDYTELSGVILRGIVDGAPTVNNSLAIRNNLVLDNGIVRMGQNGHTSIVGTAAQAIGGNGEVLLTENGSSLSLTPGGQLTIGSGVTVRGGGTLAVNGGQLINEGTIRGDSPFASLFTGSDTGSFENRGLMEVDGGSMLFDISPTFANTGVLRVARGSMTFRGSTPLAISNALRVESGGRLTGAGGVSVGATGTLSGAGNVSANVVSAGTVTPGDTVATGVSVGALTVTGDYTQGSTGDLVIELESGGTSPRNDRLVATGAIDLDGKLTVAPASTYAAAAGDRFDLLDFGSLSGTFSVVDLPSLAPGLRWDTSQLYTSGEVSVVPEPAAGALLVMAAGAVAGLRRPKTQR